MKIEKVIAETIQERHLKDGTVKKIPIFSEKQKQSIRDIVRTNSDKNLEDVLKSIGITKLQWNNIKKMKKTVLNPYLELKDSKNLTKTELQSFIDNNHEGIMNFILDKYKEIEEDDVILKLREKINVNNIKTVADIAGLSVDELASFLDKRKRNVNFLKIVKILNHFGMIN